MSEVLQLLCDVSRTVLLCSVNRKNSSGPYSWESSCKTGLVKIAW